MTTDQKNTVQVTLKIQVDAFGADLTAELYVEMIPGLVRKLREQGIEPANSPYVWEGQPADCATGSGHAGNVNGDAPLCPRHDHPMKRSKFGDGWYCPSKTDNPEWANAKVYCDFAPN